MYQVGQAVILKDKLWFVAHISATGGVDLNNLQGQYELSIERKVRPATEAKILAEIEKHGWVKDNWGCYVSPLGYLELIPEQPWAFNQKKSPATWDALALCGKEQIQASIIGNALKLCNEKPV